MLIYEYINVKFDDDDYDFNRLWKIYFSNDECKTVVKKNDMYNGVIITNVGVGSVPLFIIPSFIPRYATRIIDTYNWGFLKNTTSVKRITEEMKEEYLIILLTTPEFKF